MVPRCRRQSSSIQHPLSTAVPCFADSRYAALSTLHYYGDEVWKKDRMFLVVQMFSMNSPFRTESEGGLEGEECL